MAGDTTSNRTQAKSARRAFDLLEALAAEPDGMTAVDLAQRLELPKSSLHELLEALSSRGYVAIDPDTRRFSLGIRVWELGQAYIRYHDLTDIAHPVMQRIGRTLNETVQLSVLDGAENVYLAKVDSTHPLRLQSEVGKRLSAHATGLGKALLAHLPPDERERRLGRRSLARISATTITDRDQFEQECIAIVERGFATDNEEYEPGLRCVAVPIRNHAGVVAAAISVSIPFTRVDPMLLEQSLRLIADASLEIAHKMGAASRDSRMVALVNAPSSELQRRLTDCFGDLQPLFARAPQNQADVSAPDSP